MPQHTLFIAGPRRAPAVSEAVRGLAGARSADDWRVAFACGEASAAAWQPASEWPAEAASSAGVDARGMIARIARLLQLVPAGSSLVVRWAFEGDAPTDEALGLGVHAAVSFSEGLGIKDCRTLVVEWLDDGRAADSAALDVWADVLRARRVAVAADAPEEEAPAQCHAPGRRPRRTVSDAAPAPPSPPRRRPPS